MMIDYIAPSLDTTIYAISSAVYLFSRNPEQWSMLRKDPTLIPQAINEALRLESPVQRFTRLVTRDHSQGPRQLTESVSDTLKIPMPGSLGLGYH
jgi:cytochrome P450